MVGVLRQRQAQVEKQPSHDVEMASFRCQVHALFKGIGRVKERARFGVRVHELQSFEMSSQCDVMHRLPAIRITGMNVDRAFEELSEHGDVACLGCFNEIAWIHVVCMDFCGSGVHSITWMSTEDKKCFFC